MITKVNAFKIAIFILFLASNSVFAQQKAKVTSKEKNGLTTVTFETINGNVTVHLPSNVHTGDIISGTVVAEPKGKNEKQVVKNKNVLNGYVVELEDKKTPVHQKKEKWILPESLNEIAQLILKDHRGKVLSSTKIPISSTPRSIMISDALKNSDFDIPSYIRVGEPERIMGVFDGDFSTSAINIDDKPIEILAESPEGVFFETPGNITGPADIQLKEGDFTVVDQSNVIDMELTADKLTLSKGEETVVHIAVSGMEGLEENVPLEITNLTPGNIQMEGGNEQKIFIYPEDISNEGYFYKNLSVNATGKGRFSVLVNIEQKEDFGEKENEEENCCNIIPTTTHGNPGSEFMISENYLDQQKRQVLDSIYENIPNITNGNQNSFIRAKLPASASAIGYLDVVSGYCNAICKHILLSSTGNDIVWTTEELNVEGTTSGHHNLTVNTTDNCNSFVVGAAGGVVQVWTNGIDPIANHRTLLTALKWTRDIAVVVASGLLAVPTGGASVAVGLSTLGATQWFDSEFTQNSDAGVKAEASLLFSAKGKSLLLREHSYTQISNDGRITSDNTRICHGTESWTDPSSLSIETEGFCTMKCFSQDNGVVDGTIESQAGIVIIGFCFYPDGSWRWQYLRCSSVGLNGENIAGSISRTTNLFQTKIDLFMANEFPNTLNADQVKNKAQTELPEKLENLIRLWYMENTYDSNTKTGYFRFDN